MDTRRSHPGPKHIAVLGAVFAVLGTGCGSMNDDGQQVGVAESGLIGDFLPGLQADADLLDEAEDAFGEHEGIQDGVGPIFNERACGAWSDGRRR